MIIKLKDITPAQRRLIAAHVGTSEDVVRHIQAGVRQASADMAGRIEAAAAQIGVDLRRETLCEACGKCALAKKARKVRAPKK
jgi:hypothetical protein